MKVMMFLEPQPRKPCDLNDGNVFLSFCLKCETQKFRKGASLVKYHLCLVFGSFRLFDIVTRNSSVSPSRPPPFLFFMKILSVLWLGFILFAHPCLRICVAKLLELVSSHAKVRLKASESQMMHSANISY